MEYLEKVGGSPQLVPPLLPSTHECFRDPELRLGPGALGRPASFPSSGVRFSPLKDAARDQISGLWTL